MSSRVLTALLLLAVIQPPSQPETSLKVSEPETVNFPSVSLLVTVSDTAGRRIGGLTEDDFIILEDQQPIADFTVQEVVIGTRQVYVLNTAPGLGVRDSRGFTRFDYAREALIRFWLDKQAGMIGIDDLSLLTADGLLVQHTDSAAELSSALDQLDPSFEGGISGFDLLLLALDFSSDPMEPSTVSNALIFVTPIIETPRDLPLANAISRARESSTAVYPVLLAAPESMDTPEVQPLRDLAATTGGEFLAFDAETGIQQLAQQIVEQRQQYRITYASRANVSGTHNLQVGVTLDGVERLAVPVGYELVVQPPSVAFIQPPNALTRSTEDPELEIAQIPPTRHELQLLVTFPDGHPRELVYSELRIDEERVAERNAPPYDRFTWDLSRYSESGTHTLSALVRDELGLEARTVTIPVQLEVVRPPQGLSAIRPQMDSLLAVVAVIVAGIIMLLGVVSLARRAPSAPPTSGPRLNTIKRARLQSSARAEAQLIPLSPLGDPIPLSGVDVVLGRDASLAAIVLDDPSVERMHARLIRQADGDYLLRDQDSVAGTWVNYELVSGIGRRLQHGDLVQLGRVEFRFQLPGKQPPRPIRVTPEGETNSG